MIAAAGDRIGPDDPSWIPAVTLFRAATGAFPWEAVSDDGWAVVRDKHGGVGCGFTAAGVAELQAHAAHVPPGALAWLDQIAAGFPSQEPQKDTE